MLRTVAAVRRDRQPPRPGLRLHGMAAGKLQVVAGATDFAKNSAPSALFERLARGELDVDGYLDARVDEAIASLVGKLPAERIAWLRGMLREQLVADPVLSERVRQVTGREAPST